ncbi:MAG: site-specific integrase [Thermoplasmata archaeon]|nr:site-specific integrase [Thermoplasmata archaeon]
METIEDYLSYLEAHGRRPNTISTYRLYLERALGVLEEAGLPTDPESIGVGEIMIVKTALGDVKEGTRMRYCFVLGQMVEHYTGRNPFNEADIMWNREIPKRTFITLDQFRILCLNANPQTRMVLVLGAFLGLRRAEICGLHDSDYDLKRRTLTVRGKGHGPDGLVTIMDVPEVLAEEIENYRARVRESGLPREDDGLVQNDGRGIWRSLTPATLSWMIKSLSEKCDIEVTPHTLRRLYATTLYNEVGADLNTLRVLMRHTSVQTTLTCYVNADPQRLLDASDRASEVLSGVLGC